MIWTLRIAGSTGLLVLVGALLVYARYGGGEPYPDLNTAPRFPSQVLKTVVTSPEPIGNVATSSTGRLFYTLHPEARPPGPRLWEWVDGEAQPFPDLETQERFHTPLGLTVQGATLWVIDHGHHAWDGARLFALDLGSGEVKLEHRFDASVAPVGSFLQDLQVTDDGQLVVIADASFVRQDPALVVFEPATGRAVRRLSGFSGVRAQSWEIRNPIRAMRFFGGLVGFRVGVDGLALTPDENYLYFGAMTHDTMYRIPVEALRDLDRDDARVEAAAVAIGPKPLSDGLSADQHGYVLITDVEHGAIVRQAPNGTLTTLVQSTALRWPDALSFGPHGELYVADSAIPHLVLQSRAHIRAQGPYHVYRFRPDVPGHPGR
jgi:sugar lactone lactonase YvrE